MSQISRLAAPTLGLVTVLLLAAAVSCGGEESYTYTAVATPPFEKPVEVLPSTLGSPYNIRAETDGYLTLLYVGYTHCPDICPTQMADLATALRGLDAKTRAQVKVVFITADPERDTPAVLQKWLALFDPTFVGLRAEPPELETILDGLSMEYPVRTDLENGEYSVSHAAFVIAYTKDNLGHVVFPSGMTSDLIEEEIAHLVKEDWK